jgi:hypothetical protein
MSNLLVLIIAAVLMSCSSMESKPVRELSSPSYEFGRQMDERSLKSGFLGR